VRRHARWVLPLLVSGGLLGFLLVRFDVGRGLDQLTLRSAALLGPVLIAQALVSVWIEGLSLARLLPSGSQLTAWRCARLKAATYPVALVHYALGGGALAILLRRWAGGLGRAVGVVGLISVMDLGLLMLLAACGAAWLASAEPALRAGVLAGSLGLFVLGLLALRTPLHLGRLEKLRGASLFRAARTTPSRDLAVLALLRLAFVNAFVAAVGAALAIFGVSPPLGDVVVGAVAVALVAALPIAVAGLGTGQVAFVYVFRHWAEPSVLLACSLALSAGFLLLRGLLGLACVRELTPESLGRAPLGGEADDEPDLAR